jgi:hypothetical protein
LLPENIYNLKRFSLTHLSFASIELYYVVSLALEGNAGGVGIILSCPINIQYPPDSRLNAHMVSTSL